MTPRELITIGLTAQEYAAINLKVADSGTPWLDEMIEKSRKDEFAKASLVLLENLYKGIGISLDDINEKGFEKCFFIANQMLAASKGEK